MKSAILTTFAAVTLLAGCATPSTNSARATGPTETCYVCKYDNDLACVCVRVKDTTPRTEYDGHTYYFCSQDCQKAFAKKPARYLPKN